MSAVPEGEDKNISLDERIRQSKEKESYLGRNIHDNGKGSTNLICSSNYGIRWREFGDNL